jgi:hypothetical protein
LGLRCLGEHLRISYPLLNHLEIRTVAGSREDKKLIEPAQSPELGMLIVTCDKTRHELSPEIATEIQYMRIGHFSLAQSRRMVTGIVYLAR